MRFRRPPDIQPSEITDRDLYLNRRKFLAAAGVTLARRWSANRCWRLRPPFRICARAR